MNAQPNNALPPLQELDFSRFETPAILKSLVSSSRCLAELKALAQSVPNPEILLNSLVLQEAKDSSEIENIVTTHDELFREALQSDPNANAATKEVARYRQALQIGFQRVRDTGFLTLNHIREIQAALEKNRAGFRVHPGTVLQDRSGRTVYTPPEPDYIPPMMKALESFINDSDSFDADPLIKMALAHYQFESIHPFYDGNGRTGRIINGLYLVKEGLLDTPLLYLSRAILRTKSDYYRLLQAVRGSDSWNDWILYMLKSVEWTAIDTLATVKEIQAKLLEYKHIIRENHKFYSQDLINMLFYHPYTKIEFIENTLSVTRKTAAGYLDKLTQDGLLIKQKPGRDNYYINKALYQILTGEAPPQNATPSSAPKS